MVPDSAPAIKNLWQRSHAWLPLLVAAAWFVTAWISVKLTSRADGLAALWPSNAILLAALLLSPLRRWPSLIGATVAASTMTAGLVGHEVNVIFGFGAVNVAEPALAAIILRWVGFPRHLLASLRGVLWFTGSCTVACIGSATVGTLILQWRGNGSFLESWTTWFASDVLGLLIVTPIILITRELFRPGGSFLIARRRLIEVFLSLSAVALTSCVVFGQQAFPILFLIYPPVLFTTYRFRAPGAAASAMIVASIGLWMSAHGSGPAMMIRASEAHRIFFFQFYVAFVFLSTLPLATIIDELDALAAGKRAAETELLVAAERAASDARVLAATDELTGLCNRREFMRCLGQAIDEARTTGEALALAMFDIDHFKQVNDRFGHAGGDLVLKQLATVASRSIRTKDTVGRLGGEEFAVLFPSIDVDNASAISNRLRTEIASNPATAEMCVTISIGLAMYDVSLDADALLSRADEALYEAKRDGRNVLKRAA